MAKRSDFAQKLLDDLKQRKERLASSSQSSNRSNSSMAVIDAYSYAKKNYRGSKDTRRNDMIGAGTGNTRPKSSFNNKSSFTRDSAQHIVPYNNGGARSSHHIGDLSMALSLALQNRAKTRRTDSSTTSFALEFLQQIGGKMETRGSNSRRFQIDEIAKGANRLNQILRACSNGMNLDQFSIQIGKDLLKGAVDLENSLKLLVDLQEASGNSAEPQRKNRIRLLEEDEDEERGANVAEEWKLDRPRFSFDRTDKHGSHRRSASSGANPVSSSSLGEFKAKPSSSPQKARIPSVIAKLMGLEKLPEPEKEIGNTSGSKEVEANPFDVNKSFYSFDVVFHGEKPTTISEKTAPRKERAQEMNTKNNPPASKERQTQPLVRDRSAKLAVSPARKPKGNEANSKIASTKSNKEKPNKKSPRKSTSLVQSEVFRDRSSQKISNSEQSSSETESMPNLQRIKVPKDHSEHKLPQKIDETVIRRSVRHQRSPSKEAKNPRRLEKLGNREDAKIKPNDSEAKDRREMMKEAQKRFGLFTVKEDVRTRMEEPAQRLSSQDVTLDDQRNQVQLCEDQELVDIENELDDEAMNIDVNTKTREQTEAVEEPITLTDSENRLKDILVKSPVFLNTAVALFDLEIPIDVLQPSSHNHNDGSDDTSDEKEQRRLALDCGYEIIRRKGRREELSLHPNHAKASIGFVKIRAFDGLVREVSRELEKLRVYGGGEEYLITMQESDVMWELGWSESFFAFVQVGEIARDVEKFVLNALLDEIAAQLLRRCH